MRPEEDFVVTALELWGGCECTVNRVGDRYFGRYWIQTIRFLARTKLLGQKQAEVQTDRRRYQRNQPIQIRVRFPNPGLAPASGEVHVQVERKGQGPRRLNTYNKCAR